MTIIVLEIEEFLPPHLTVDTRGARVTDLRSGILTLHNGPAARTTEAITRYEERYVRPRNAVR